jgi:hypothetical protein
MLDIAISRDSGNEAASGSTHANGLFFKTMQVEE